MTAMQRSQHRWRPIQSNGEKPLVGKPGREMASPAAYFQDRCGLGYSTKQPGEKFSLGLVGPPPFCAAVPRLILVRVGVEYLPSHGISTPKINTGT